MLVLGWKFGVRYCHGKVMFFKTNDGKFGNPGVLPDWSIDIREILAMLFVGIAVLLLICYDYIHEAMYLLLPLLGYALGRTVPYPSTRVYEELLKEFLEQKKKES